ncbi:MAG: hypothetical protein INR70_36790 [Parafilimonas terrae]|nr:hypothetical protein [Parafilimonas terrae]
MSFGFAPEAPGVLADALVSHALSNPSGTSVLPSYEPPRIVCEGTVVAPDGREMPLRTVWEMRGSTEMVFITAVPLTRSRA